MDEEVDGQIEHMVTTPLEFQDLVDIITIYQVKEEMFDFILGNGLIHSFMN